jgi:hypothetical protein
MERFRNDRRHPRIRVDDLRRDLREADEDLFRLETALKMKGGSSWLNARIIGGAVLLAALGSVLSVANAPAGAKPLLPAVNASPMLESATPPGASSSLPVRVRYAGPNVAPAQRRAIHRPAARPASALSKARPKPRPLSPGEFGRAARG